MAAINRAQWLADARALLDLIETNPELPLGGFRIAAYANTGDDDTDREFVDAVASVLGAEPETSPYGRHYQAHVAIGHAMYEVTAIPAAALRRYNTVQELGKAALAEQEPVDGAEAVSAR